ncbi:hypothetical protein LTR53_010380 [Teratosphaeriaceae sp. CCFEE 6253]|nr:hypothetical protein LTR53_010380 [Teratosphaeriaceae sp. CCFEE 6253]
MDPYFHATPMAAGDVKLEYGDPTSIDMHQIASLDTDSTGQPHRLPEQDTQIDSINASGTSGVDMDQQIPQDINAIIGQYGEDSSRIAELTEHTSNAPSGIVHEQSSPGERKLGGDLFVPLHPGAGAAFEETLESPKTTATPLTYDSIPASEATNAPEQSLASPVSIAGNKRAEVGSAAGLQSKPRKRQRANAHQVPGYDDNTEKDVSQLAVDQPCFKSAEKLVPVICDKVIDKIEALKGRGYNDQEIESICTKLKNLRYVHKAWPEATIVGFLGDTAAGKSSLINCLLNQENIVGENDDGDSGTSVPQELALADVDQVEMMKAVVYYSPQRKINDRNEQHFKDIYDHNNTDHNECDKEEQKRLLMCYHTALGFFTTLLCDRDDFKTLKAAEAFFADAANDTDKVILGPVKQYVAEYMATLGRIGGATFIAGNSLAEVNRQLKEFRGPVKAPEGTGLISSPWPLVSKITTHLHARILGEGLKVADLPGTSDVNRLRVQATRDYLKNCDSIVIPHPILRIQSQDSVWTNIMECVRAGKQSSIILVCTKIDDMKHGRQRDTVSASDQAMLDELKLQFDALTVKVEDLREQLDEAENGDDDADYMRLNRELKKTVLQKAEKEAEWKEENILARNRRTVAELKKKFREYTRTDEDVSVFCVSNTLYQEHMHGYDRTSPPQLSLEATDVPRLRQHLFEIPARRKLAALFRLTKKCSKTRLERKKDLEHRIVKPLADFKTLLVDLKIDIKHSFEKVVEEVVATYGAFCRRWGSWRVAGKVNVHWNAAINDIFQDNLLDGFATIKSTLIEVKDSVRKQLDLPLEQLDLDLRESPELMGLDLEGFHKLIEITRTTVDEEATSQFRDLERAINEIRYSATSIETATSYLMQHMKEVYQACQDRRKEAGSGTFKDMKTIMSTKLYGARNVFLGVMEMVASNLYYQVDGWTAAVEKQIGVQLNGIIRDFNNRFDNVEPEDQTKREFRQELLGTVKETMGMMDTEMAAVLKECEAFR